MRHISDNAHSPEVFYARTTRKTTTSITIDQFRSRNNLPTRKKLTKIS